ncbi:MAG: hypothetical protein ACREGI_03200 [Candidatus Levyibacteriota bacterium]
MAEKPHPDGQFATFRVKPEAFATPEVLGGRVVNPTGEWQRFVLPESVLEDGARPGVRRPIGPSLGDPSPGQWNGGLPGV